MCVYEQVNLKTELYKVILNLPTINCIQGIEFVKDYYFLTTSKNLPLDLSAS